MHARTAQDAETGAERAAREMAAQAGVEIAGLTGPDEAAEMAALFMEVWETSTEHAPLSPDLLGALSFTGQYVATARRNGVLVGGSVGFRMEQDGSAELHSHITGVLPFAQGRHVGLALKLHQRAWAVRHGFAAINWTYDPLMRRNAYFNLTKLGATAKRYRVNAYGEMADAINAGEPSDRYIAEWAMESAGGARTVVKPDDSDVVLYRGRDGIPMSADPERGRARRIAWIPEDILSLRRTDPELALRWRLSLRAVLVAAMEDGFVATGMTRDGWYVLERRP